MKFCAYCHQYYSEDDIKIKVTQLKNFIGNSRFKISNESLKELYSKIKEIFGDD